MVSSALWTDYDNDGYFDLLLAGEFMPVTIVKNDNGKLKSDSAIKLPGSGGWWNSIAGADFDNDGDIDYIAGNLGLNSRFKATPEKPLCIYAKDFDKNGRIDPVLCYYVNDKNYIYPTRDEMIRQISSMRGRFETYESFANVTLTESFTPAELKDAVVVKVESTESAYFENLGNGNFARKSLPIQAQFAPIYGMLTEDFDNDGLMDVLVAGNSYATETSTGRYDAMRGLVLKGKGNGDFEVLPTEGNGLAADRDVKSLVQINTKQNRLLLVANNNDKMESYTVNSKNTRSAPAKLHDAYAIVQLKNGRTYKQEFYYGSNYLSQSSRQVIWGDKVQSIVFYDDKNQKRIVQ